MTKELFGALREELSGAPEDPLPTETGQMVYATPRPPSLGTYIHMHSLLTASKLHVPPLGHSHEPGFYHPLLVWVQQLEIIVPDQSPCNLGNFNVRKVLSGTHVVAVAPLT